MLHNKLPQNFATENSNKSLLLHPVSVGQELRNVLAGWFCLQCSHKAAIRMSAGAADI